MVGLVSDRESGIGTGLTSDCHRISRIGNELALDRIDVALATDWRQIGMDWRWIGAELASNWQQIGAGLALDRQQIGVGLALG